MDTFRSFARTVIPQRTKRFLRERRRRLDRKRVFSQAMRQVAKVSVAVDLPMSTIEALIYGWGNESMSAREEFIQGLWHSAWEASGPILECGSGLSTLLLGHVAQKTGNKVWSLEDASLWARKVRSALKRYRIDSVEVCSAALRSYGTFTWYEPPKDLIPRDFSLVICDGPHSRTTPGGRYGLIPAMKSHLRPGCVILLDDAQRVGEQEVLDHWARELHVAYELIGTNKPYARLTTPPVVM